ncbi:MAG: transferase [Candidatus Vogelbacteria bacterium]|nr:transferase [Candidatus Vogelbacteria bacterium]
MKRFLITTPLKETWKKDEPILFLGEWCLTYPHKSSHLAVDTEVMPYHWNDRSKLYKDYQYISSYYEVILNKLALKLNEIHKVDHSLRYWRILIGPWLGQFMLMMFDNWSSVHQAINRYDLSGSILLTGKEESFIPNDMSEFNSFFPSDEWNHHTYSRILEHFPSLSLYHKSRSESSFPNTSTAVPNIKKHIKNKLKPLLGPLMTHLGHLFSHEEDALLLSTYLSMREEIDLSIRLGQFPRLLRPSITVKTTPDYNQRRWTLERKSDSEFETCLQALLPQQIPCVYLEGYKKLVQQSNQLAWPKRPKTIWTSNAFHSDDLFKVWTADKVERGSPLIIGQHGGNYGMGLWNWGEQHEMAISDHYWSWGWSRPSTPKIQPVGKIKYSRPVKHLYEEGSALLVTVMLQRYGNPTLSMYTSSQWLEYLREQFDFVDALPAHIQDKLIVRLSQPDYGWHQVDRWRDHFPRLQINDGTSDINNLIRQSRLYISTYNATTYLESLSMNMPTIIYWDPKYMETNVWAQPYFDELRSVGIFHETPQSAALHVTRIWDNIDKWWISPETCAVRNRFVKQYAYCPKDKMSRLKNAINEVIKQ